MQDVETLEAAIATTVAATADLAGNVQTLAESGTLVCQVIGRISVDLADLAKRVERIEMLISAPAGRA